MKRLMLAVGFAVAAVACGGSTEAPPSSGAASTSTATGSDQLEVRLTQPTIARTGDNTFEVTVMQGSQPVTDANVSVELFMAAMPSMNMPEMRNRVTLAHQGDGRYSGTGSVMMGGAWDATVMVMRGDQHLGDQKLTLVAQ